MQKSDPDQPDELKMMVTLEQLIKTADVAANMQRWETMLLWSSRLFKEQKNCFINGHGPDPEHDWYENQIAFNIINNARNNVVISGDNIKF